MVLLFTVPIGNSFEHGGSDFLAWLAGSDRMADRRGTVPVGDRRRVAENRIARWAVIVLLVVFKRWRGRLFVFVGTILVVTWLVEQLQLVTGRARPLGVTIIGSWEGFSFPSATVAAAAITGSACCTPCSSRGGPGGWASGSCGACSAS